MPGADQDERLNEILDMIGCMAALDFSKTIETSDQNDMIDAIALGLNMLSEELNTQVVARAKLDEVNLKLEKFAYTTAHDLKSPINSSTALIQLIEMYIDKPEKSDLLEFVQKLKQTNASMMSLVEGILEYSRTWSEEMTLEKIDFNNLVKDVIELDGLDKKATITTINNLPIVLYNKIAGVQVVRNLLDNAIKYCDKDECQIKISSKEFDDHYEISFQDNGPGIPKIYHKKIFEIFNQVEPTIQSNSVGIGLSTVKSIIEKHGGRIWLSSKQNHGTTFIFTLMKPKNR